MKLMGVPKLPPGPEAPTLQTQQEMELYHCKESDLRLRGIAQDIEERKTYARKTFRLAGWWLFGVFVLLILGGLKMEPLMFQLPESVLLAVIGGTTLNILGVFVFVMKYLFDVKREV
ncbi:MAG: hypothetical protein WB626_12655 [Bacteroidota bacterium]